MENIHQEARLATTGPKEEKLSKDLNKVIDETNPKAARAKALLTVRAIEGSSCRRAIMAQGYWLRMLTCCAGVWCLLIGQKMKEESSKLKGDSRVNQSQVRIRDNLSNTLTRKFVDVMKVGANVLLVGGGAPRTMSTMTA